MTFGNSRIKQTSTRRTKMRWAKGFVVLLAGALLLSPALMMASVWTNVDLIVSVVAVSTCILVAQFAQRWRWPCAIIASLLIAVPPYPYWLFASEERGWYLHFFHGYSVHEVPILRFSAVMIVALLLFGVIFWALGGRKQQGRN